MKKNAFTGFIVFAVLIAAAVLVIYSSINKSTSNENTVTYNSEKNTTVIKKQSADYIARINIIGQIGSENRTYNQKWLLSTIKAITEDEKNTGLLIFIDSPGGAVYETDEVYLAIKKYKETGKKVYIYMGSIAASGGYYISCAADKIYANRNTLTGSIGVIAGQSMDITELLNKAGIKSETIHAGKNKNMGNYNEPLSDEQRKILQSVADECYDQFTGIVSTDRKIPIEKVRELADGRIYTAKQAKELKLIDAIDTWDNMEEEFKKNVIKNPECKIIEMSVPQNNSIFNIMNYAKSSISDAQLSSKLGLPLNVIKQFNDETSYPAFIYEN